MPVSSSFLISLLVPRRMADFDPNSSAVECANTTSTNLPFQDTTGAPTYDGLFLSVNPVEYMIRMFPLQLSLTAFAQATCQFFLTPLGETTVVSQILGGILLGPSVWASNTTFRTIFPENGFYILETLGWFAIMIHMFLIGVTMDLSILKRTSNKERVIGLLTFCVPLVLTVPISLYLMRYAEESAKESLIVAAILMATTSFHVIGCFLSDLKILNTELGRIAISASTVSGICSWITIGVTFSVKSNDSQSWLPYTCSAIAQVVFIVVVLRKIVIWIIKQTPQGEPLKEVYLYCILLMIIGTGLIGELCGQHCTFGPMILGLAIPDGPPVGSALADKLESFVSGMLMPVYFCNVSYNIHFNKETNIRWIIMILSLMSFLGKVMGTIIPSIILCELPLRDAFTLSLILSTLGIFDVQSYYFAFSSKFLDTSVFTYMILNILVVTGVISPLVRILYNPSRRYNIYKERTLQNTKNNVELRIMVCIYSEENVPTIMNILEASNPTRECPIGIYVIHLVELAGRSTPLLINHKTHKSLFNEPSPSDHIINSFRIYEKRNPNAIFLQPYTSITPFVSAHDDICTISLEKKTSFIILPFHKKWNIDGTTEICKWVVPNKKVLKQAPCSVGILVDRGVLNHAKFIHSTWSSYKIGVIFLGDGDDREALCYAMRMGQNKNVNLTVLRIMFTENVTYDLTEKMLDNNVINEYKMITTTNDQNLYKEESITDVVEIISLIRELENDYNLILVGKNHNTYSKLLTGLNEWNEHPELGIFGDLLASSDFKGNASILVVQQHSCLSTDTMTDSPYQET